jgi:hypothetical protein
MATFTTFAQKSKANSDNTKRATVQVPYIIISLFQIEKRTETFV